MRGVSVRCAVAALRLRRACRGAGWRSARRYVARGSACAACPGRAGAEQKSAQLSQQKRGGSTARIKTSLLRRPRTAAARRNPTQQSALAGSASQRAARARQHQRPDQLLTDARQRPGSSPQRPSLEPLCQLAGSGARRRSASPWGPPPLWQPPGGLGGGMGQEEQQRDRCARAPGGHQPPWRACQRSRGPRSWRQHREPRAPPAGPAHVRRDGRCTDAVALLARCRAKRKRKAAEPGFKKWVAATRASMGAAVPGGRRSSRRCRGRRRASRLHLPSLRRPAAAAARPPQGPLRVRQLQARHLGPGARALRGVPRLRPVPGVLLGGRRGAPAQGQPRLPRHRAARLPRLPARLEGEPALPRRRARPWRAGSVVCPWVVHAARRPPAQ
jgi:hypothetical protein